MIQNKNIARRYQRDFIPVGNFYGQEAIDFQTGLAMAAAATVKIGIPVPSHWDYEEDIGVRVHYESDGDEDAVLWLVNYELAAFAAAIPTINDALDTVIASDTTSGVNLGKDATPWGKINGATIDPEASASDMLYFLVTLTSTAGANPKFTGLEVAYLPDLALNERSTGDDFPTDA